MSRKCLLTLPAENQETSFAGFYQSAPNWPWCAVVAGPSVQGFLGRRSLVYRTKLIIIVFNPATHPKPLKPEGPLGTCEVKSPLGESHRILDAGFREVPGAGSSASGGTGTAGRALPGSPADPGPGGVGFSSSSFQVFHHLCFLHMLHPVQVPPRRPEHSLLPAKGSHR